MLCAIISTPLGPLRLAAARDALVYCNWMHPQCESKFHKMEKLYPKGRWQGEEAVLLVARLQLEEYFQGMRRHFEIPCEVKGSPFQIKVWDTMKRIPLGETTSYSQLAAMSGNPSSIRAVANACGRNPLAIIFPCHRIVAASGPGGYTGGTEKKLALLRHEASFEKGNGIFHD